MATNNVPPSGGESGFIFCRFITVKGVRIPHPTGGVFKIPKDKLNSKKNKDEKVN